MTREEAIELLGLTEIFEPLTEEGIKQAYRRMSQRWHPDREGGNTEKFQKIKAAYEFLTGGPEPNNTQAQILQRISQIFLTAVEHQDEGANITELVVLTITRARKEMDAAIATTSRAIRKRETMLKRLRGRTPEHQVLQDLLRQNIKQHQQSLRQVQAEKDLTDRMLEFMKDYQYDYERRDEEALLTLGRFLKGGPI